MHTATPLYTPSFDMRSHRPRTGASSEPKFDSYVKQRTWFVEQLACLLDQLAARPEGAGTMLDNTIVLACSESSDGDPSLTTYGQGGQGLLTNLLA